MSTDSLPKMDKRLYNIYLYDELPTGRILIIPVYNPECGDVAEPFVNSIPLIWSLWPAPELSWMRGSLIECLSRQHRFRFRSQPIMCALFSLSNSFISSFYSILPTHAYLKQYTYYFSFTLSYQRKS